MVNCALTYKQAQLIFKKPTEKVNAKQAKKIILNTNKFAFWFSSLFDLEPERSPKYKRRKGEKEERNHSRQQLRIELSENLKHSLRS